MVESNSKSMLAFGEVLFDMIEGHAHLGGASLNVAAHFAKHNNEAFLLSALGNDTPGREARKIAKSYGIKTDLFQQNHYPTGTVNVQLTAQGQPSYEIVENVAWDKIDARQSDLEYIKSKNWDVFYFGSLAQRSAQNRDTLDVIFNETRFTQVFFDVNLRKDYFNVSLIQDSLARCTILKLNDEEVNVLGPLLFNEQLGLDEFANKVSQKYHINNIIITLGENGAAYLHNGHFGKVPGIKVKVADTVGAGDSFSAAFLNAYLKGAGIENAVAAGCALGAYVASQHGAVPHY